MVCDYGMHTQYIYKNISHCHNEIKATYVSINYYWISDTFDSDINSQFSTITKLKSPPIFGQSANLNVVFLLNCQI